MTRQMPIRAHLCALLLALFATASFPSMAFSQNKDVIEEARSLSQSAMEDYDFFELESADEKIMNAVRIIDENGVTDKTVAVIYVAQGVISYGRFKDSAKAIADDRAFSAFLKALTINPDVSIPNDYRSAELEAIMDRARDTIASTPKTSIAAMAGVKPSIAHTGVATSQRCSAIKIAANVPAHPDVYRVTVYYSPDDVRGFTSIEMQPSADVKDNFVAIIPGLDAQGSTVRYFIEATNREGDIVAQAADEAHPVTTMLTGECAGFSDEELALQYGDPVAQISIMVGTGVGIVGGSGNSDSALAYTKPSGSSQLFVSRGAAIMPLHLRGSIMFNLPADFQLGAYIRGQLVNIVGKTNNNAEDAEVVGNIMVGAALRYLAISRQPYRLYVGVEAGWGGANATVNSGAAGDGFKAIYILKGPFHITPEIGFLWTFHKNVGLAVELAVPIHFPDKVNAHFDLSVGPFFQF